MGLLLRSFSNEPAVKAEISWRIHKRAIVPLKDNLILVLHDCTDKLISKFICKTSRNIDLVY